MQWRLGNDIPARPLGLLKGRLLDRKPDTLVECDNRTGPVCSADSDTAVAVALDPEVLHHSPPLFNAKHTPTNNRKGLFDDIALC
jgi:hypothetical protein